MKLIEKFKKEDLEKFIFEEKLSYCEIGRRYSVSSTYIKKVANKLGIKLEKRKNFPKGFIPYIKGKGKKVFCKNCGGKVNTSINTKQIFCSFKCSNEYKISDKYQYYLKNQKEFCYDRNMSFIKKHILIEQNNCCAICNSLNKWNDKELIFVLDHIDGSAANNMRENIRLVCPNCDSQLATYKSKNKNSARKERYLRNYKN